MINISTGLKAGILSNYGLSLYMNHGVFDLYTGAQPTTANYAPTGSFLGRITNGGATFVEGDTSTGCELGQAFTGSLIQKGSWILVPTATGEIGWWRWRWFQHDPGTNSSYYPRVDGAYGEGLVLGGANIAKGSNVAIQGFSLDLIGDS